MNKVSFEALKLRSFLEHLERSPSIDNAKKLLYELELIKHENFQFIQDVFLSRLLILMDSADGLRRYEFKTALLKCMNIILLGSRIMKELPYKTILCIVLKQIYDYTTNNYQKDLPEELKIAAFKCFEASSCNIDFDVVEIFMNNNNKILLGQCIFVCKEAISKESYLQLRKSAVEALMSLTQCHDKFDQHDIVLRQQISKILFIVLPQVATVLIKVCQEDCLRGPLLQQAALKCLGRFLCLILQDYEKKNHISVTNNEFLKLVDSKNVEHKSQISTKVTKLNADKVEMSNEWMEMTSKNLSKIIINLKCLQGSEYTKIRFELATLSFNLLSKCLMNSKLFIGFLLENLILLSDDSDEQIQQYSQNGLKVLSTLILNINQEISELFSIHLTEMPRIVMTGLVAEQYSGIILMNSFIKILSSSNEFEAIFENQIILKKIISIMTICSEINVPQELIFHEITNSSELNDEFYKMEKPWKKFKNLKSEAVVRKFTNVCRTLGSSKFSIICINFIMDNINSVEYLVLLNEILQSNENENDIGIDQFNTMMEEFLSEIYWNMQTRTVSQITTSSNAREEWYKDSTPGLYESAIEVKLKSISLKDDERENEIISNLKTIKYNILCTCTLLELIGNVALQLKSKFQRYVLRCLHLVLEKAGNCNFLIKTAGLYALNCISRALEHSDISQLIDANSDYLLFNINKLLKHDCENESVFDMMSIIFKYSKASMTAYIEDIVDMIANQITNEKHSKNVTSQLKLFNLYIDKVRQWREGVEGTEIISIIIKTDWNEFLEQCNFEIQCDKQDEEQNIEESSKEATMSNEINQEASEGETQKEEEIIPHHIQLVVKILNSSLPFFATSHSKDIILAHEIFLNGFVVLHIYENKFLPLVDKMWYPFTKQFQGQDFVVLQYSVRLLIIIGKFAKGFVYKRSMDKVIPVLNTFLISSYDRTNKKENLSYTQEFKLQREVLSDYGDLTIYLGIEDEQLDEIINILLMFFKHHSSEQLKNAAKKSLDVISQKDPLLIHLKINCK